MMLGNSTLTEIATNADIIWTSDARFKKNIKENVPGLEFIRQLRPVTYNFDIHRLDAHISGKVEQRDEEAITSKEKKLYTGFLAQEVEAAANKLGYDFNGVHKPANDKDVYGLGYVSFVVPLVKSVQELSKMDDEKDTKIEALQNQNNDLEKRIEKLESTIYAQSAASSQSAKSVSITDASLEQNIPNPFTNSTTIGYNLPQKFTMAQILITDNNGKLLKQANISGAGKGKLNVDVTALSSGAYSYSLVIDGKIITSKKMVVAK